MSHPLRDGRHAWLQVLRGGLNLNGQTLAAGDGTAVSEESALTIRAGAGGPSEVMLFDLG